MSANTAAATAALAAVAPTPAPEQPAALDNRRVLQLQATVLAHDTLQASATAFATELADQFGCSRVTIGFVQHGAIDLVATSRGHGEKLVGEGYDAIAAAMDEAVQQAASVQVPTDPGARSMIRLAHARLHQREGGAFASMPLLHAGVVVGAVTCGWTRVPEALPARVEQLETLVNLVGPVLYLMRLHETPLHQRAWARLGRAWRDLRGIRDRRVQCAIGLGLVAAVALCAVPVPYRVGGTARLEGLMQRTLAAPTDGYIKAVHVRPGDTVKQGQVLLEMADQDLALQRRKWTSELDQQESAHAVALAKADRSALVVALARAEQARSQLALVDADIARASIVAPFDGIVLQGDLAPSIGAPVERGKPLLTVAPGAALRVVVDIDERDVAQVRAGQHGTLALAAMPWDALPLQVTRVTPIARTVDGNNVFEVEAELTAEGAARAARVRPGQEGVAKLAVAERPLAWAGSHRLAEWLRLKVWAWWY